MLDQVDDVALLADNNGSVKYLMPVEGVSPRAPIQDACAFQNTARFAYHLIFLQALPGGETLDFEEYIDLVLKRDTRAWWGGEVAWLLERVHPITMDAGTLVFSLYTEDSPGNRLTIDDVRAVHAG
jgi:hypothetical protein